MAAHPDVVVIGGGVIGAAIAMFLRRDGDCHVTVVKRDTACRTATSRVSANRPLRDLNVI